MVTIGKAAAWAGVSVDTVRFYERTGLLPRPPRSASRYRLYDKEMVARLRFIVRAKALGFSLEDIRALLFLNDGGGTRQAVRTIAQKRLAEVSRRIEVLAQLRDRLAHQLRDCDSDGPITSCPLIAALASETDTLESPPAAPQPAFT